MKHIEDYPDFHRLLKCVGHYFRQLRLQKDEKIYSVSSSLGLSHPVISKIENGLYHPLSLKLIVRLLDYYQTTITELLIYIINALDQKGSFILVSDRNSFSPSVIGLKNGSDFLHVVNGSKESTDK